jgi:hypothetical protein
MHSQLPIFRLELYVLFAVTIMRHQLFVASAALKDINYAGWIVLETSSPSKDPVADARRNADFVHRLLA